jgi:hypothetical protein
MVYQDGKQIVLSYRVREYDVPRDVRDAADRNRHAAL